MVIAAWMLVAAGLAGQVEAGREMARRSIESGNALEHLRVMVSAQGGDPESLDRPLMGCKPRAVGKLVAERSGVIVGLDARQVGHAALSAGAGRRRKSDEVDPAAGIRLAAKVGDTVEEGAVLAQVMAKSKAHLAEAVERLGGAYEIGEQAPAMGEVILEQMAAAGGVQE